MKLYNMLGYKLFKEDGDKIHMIRIVGMHKPITVDKNTPDPAEITIYDYDKQHKETVRVETLKGYSPLKPDGILNLSIVNIKGKDDKLHRDVIVSAIKYIEVELGIPGISDSPYVVCRQSINDIFYNLFNNDPDHKSLVGLSVNKETCPANFDFRLMMACDNVMRTDFINFYRTDVIDDLLQVIKTGAYDETLGLLYNKHVVAKHDPSLSFKNTDEGWCRNLRTLLKENAFQADINQMLGITDVDFNIEDYIDKKPIPDSDETYDIANEEFRDWISLAYKIPVKEVGILEYGHDINLADFNNARYFIYRDKTKKLYLLVYTIEGEYHEAELEEKAKKLDFSSKFKLGFYNKYNTNNK